MTKLSVKKPYTVLVGVVLIIVLGIVSFLGLNTDLLPTMDLPYVVVYTVYPGASPEKVEQSVTKPVESAVSTTSGLENVTSISQENVSMLILEFSQSTNMDSAMLELSTNLDTVSGSFDDMVQSPVMMKMNPNMLPVELVSIDADGMDIKRLTEYVNTALQEVKENAFTVKLPDGQIKDMEFDLGFNCLGMRSNNPVLPELEEAFKDTDTYVYTIGDSVRARRIMEGTMEGRAILNVLESQGYLHLEPLE